VQIAGKNSFLPLLSKISSKKKALRTNPGDANPAVVLVKTTEALSVKCSTLCAANAANLARFRFSPAMIVRYIAAIATPSRDNFPCNNQMRPSGRIFYAILQISALYILFCRSPRFIYYFANLRALRGLVVCALLILIPNKKFPKNLRQNPGFTIFTQILVLSLFGIRIIPRANRKADETLALWS
jgi:hypothetical protein